MVQIVVRLGQLLGMRRRCVAGLPHKGHNSADAQISPQNELNELDQTLTREFILDIEKNRPHSLDSNLAIGPSRCPEGRKQSVQILIVDCRAVLHVID